MIEFTAPPGFPASGFQLAMVLLSRGFEGPCRVDRLPDDAFPPPTRLRTGPPILREVFPPAYGRVTWADAAPCTGGCVA